MNAIWGFLLALFLALAGEYLARDHRPGPRPAEGRHQRHHDGDPARHPGQQPVQAARGAASRASSSRVVRILRLGIVLLGIRLSIVEAGAIGLKALPVIIGTVVCGDRDRHLRQPARRPHRPARHADRRRHQHLRRDGDRRDVADHRRQRRRDELRRRLHHAVRRGRHAGLPVRRALAVRRRSVRGRPVPRHGRARDGAGRRRRPRLPGVLQRPEGARRRHGHQAGAQPEHAAGDPDDGRPLPPPLERGRQRARSGTP